MDSLQKMMFTLGGPIAYQESGKLLNAIQNGDCVVSDEERVSLIRDRMWLADNLANDYLHLCGVGTTVKGELEAYQKLFQDMRINNMAIFDKISFVDVVKGYALCAARECSDSISPDAVVKLIDAMDETLRKITPNAARNAMSAYREDKSNVAD